MPAPKKIDPALLQFATPTQRRYLEETIRQGSMRKAAMKLGVNKSSVEQAYNRVRNAASLRGYSPEHDMTKVVPPTHYVKGTSTLYDRYNEPILQWVKSQADSDMMQETAEQMARAFFEDRKPLKPLKPPKKVDEDLQTTYVLSDLHLGMFSWARETGDDYDCEVASELLMNAMHRLVSRAPASKYCVIAQLGDLLHLDDDTNQTKRGKNALDVDTRYQRVSEVGFSLYRYAIDIALRRHGHVHVVNVPGNHDDISSWWLGVAIEVAYANEARVTVDNSPGPYFYHRFGNNLFGFTHGNDAKMEDLGEIMVSDVPSDVGETEYRFWYTGHVHHQQIKELRSCLVESFRTLAAKDAWHSKKGYRSKRDMRCIVHHRELGEDERFRVGVRELEKDAA